MFACLGKSTYKRPMYICNWRIEDKTNIYKAGENESSCVFLTPVWGCYFSFYMVILTLIVTFFLGCFICINTDMMRSSKTTPDATPITVLWVLLIWWKKPLDFFSVRDDHKDQRKHKMKNEHFSTQIRITIELILFIFIITLLHNQGSWCSILHNNPLTHGVQAFTK